MTQIASSRTIGCDFNSDETAVFVALHASLCMETEHRRRR